MIHHQQLMLNLELLEKQKDTTLNYKNDYNSQYE